MKKNIIKLLKAADDPEIENKGVAPTLLTNFDCLSRV
jgi:hypothetical protein